MKIPPLLGGALLIAGITLGAGMLAFPTATSFGGFIPSIILFIFVWLVMLSSAFFFLDANLSIKGTSNMISMAEKTLGNWGKLLSWVVYLLLLYSLTAAYIAGCTPLIIEAIYKLTGYTLPDWIAPFSLPILFGGFIYSGTREVDLVNRFLMIALIVAYILLILFVPSQIDLKNLTYFNFPATTLAISVVITAFGYHIIIPSLSTYLKRDRKQMKKTIIFGSLIPIFVYLLWQILILGAVPKNLLFEAYAKGASAVVPLSEVLKSPWIGLVAKFFAFFAIVTSFIGVTLSLSDFLSDGFKLKGVHGGRIFAILLTFVPPLFFVYTYPKGFYTALEYAGVFVAILLIFLPTAMVWKLEKYQTIPRKFFLIFIMLIAASVIAFNIAEKIGNFKSLTIPKQFQKNV